MFRKSQPEYKSNCKCNDEQFHFLPQDDITKKTEQVVTNYSTNPSNANAAKSMLRLLSISSVLSERALRPRLIPSVAIISARYGS